MFGNSWLAQLNLTFSNKILAGTTKWHFMLGWNFKLEPEQESMVLAGGARVDEGLGRDVGAFLY